MDKSSRREAVRDYKERKARAGIFRIDGGGRTWVALSRNLDAQKNGLWFALRLGSHPNRPLVAAWNTHGEAAFQFAEVEVLEDEDLTDYGREQWLKERERHWLQALGASKVAG